MVTGPVRLSFVWPIPFHLVPFCLCRWRGERVKSETEVYGPASSASSSTSPATASRHQPQFLSQLHLFLLRAATAPVAPLPCRASQKPPAAFETDPLLKSLEYFCILNTDFHHCKIWLSKDWCRKIDIGYGIFNGNKCLLDQNVGLWFLK